MSKVTIIDNDRATLWYHPDSGIIHHRFKKAVSGHEFREILDTGLDALKEHKATKWLSDELNNSALVPEDSRWAMGDWQPRAVAAGWRHWAVVLPEGVIGKMDMAKYIAQNRDAGVEVRVFSDHAEALAWLESQA
jgi:hypothetical protein